MSKQKNPTKKSISVCPYFRQRIAKWALDHNTSMMVISRLINSFTSEEEFSKYIKENKHKQEGVRVSFHTLRKSIIKTLSTKYMTIPEIVEETWASEKQVRSILDTNFKPGSLKRKRGGKFKLTKKAELYTQNEIQVIVKKQNSKDYPREKILEETQKILEKQPYIVKTSLVTELKDRFKAQYKYNTKKLMKILDENPRFTMTAVRNSIRISLTNPDFTEDTD